MSAFEKCPHCGAWKKRSELVNHIGACAIYQQPRREALWLSLTNETNFCLKTHRLSGISGENGGKHHGHEKENINYVISERQAAP
jgi:hypothetical protein